MKASLSLVILHGAVCLIPLFVCFYLIRLEVNPIWTTSLCAGFSLIGGLFTTIICLSSARKVTTHASHFVMSFFVVLTYLMSFALWAITMFFIMFVMFGKLAD